MPIASLEQLIEVLRAYCQAQFTGEQPVYLDVHFLSGRHLCTPISPFGPPRPTVPDSHSEDYRRCWWKGLEYTFSPTQAAVIKVLWEAMEDGEQELSQETVLEKAGSECSRLRPLFQGHPAIDAMIVNGVTRGSFRLNSA